MDVLTKRRSMLSVWQLGLASGAMLAQLMETSQEGYRMDPVSYEVKNNMLDITLPKISGLILKAL